MRMQIKSRTGMTLKFNVGMKVTVRLEVILRGFTWNLARCEVEGDFERIHLGFGDAGLLRNNPHMGPPFSQQHLSENRLVL